MVFGNSEVRMRKLIENISMVIVMAYVCWPLWFVPIGIILLWIKEPLTRPW